MAHYFVKKKLATAESRGTREREFALGLSREVEHIGVVIFVCVV